MFPNKRDNKFSQDLEESPEVQRSPQVNKQNLHQGEEIQGSLAHSEQLDKLMRSVLENDKDIIPEGTMLSEGISHGLQSFTPDLLFEQFVQNYRQAKNLYGERLIRELSGYDPSYVERNIRIPEFKRELKSKMQQSIKNLQDKGFLNKQGVVTDTGLTVASLAMVSEELDKLNKKGALGERANKASSFEGEKADVSSYKSHHRFKDIALKASIKKSLRRGHTELSKDDLVVHTYESKERATLLYAIDASGSMKGEKLVAAKKAGVALAFKALQKKDKVACLVFGKEIVAEQYPTDDFFSLVKTMLKAQAAKETDIAATIRHATTILENVKGLKHIMLLTDGLQTVGTTGDVLKVVGEAAAIGITISIVGLSLDNEGETLSKQIVELGKGTLYRVKNYDNLDVMLLEDYYKTTRR